MFYLARAFFEGPREDDAFELFVGKIKDMPKNELVKYLKSKESLLNQAAADAWETDCPEAGEYTFDVYKSDTGVMVEWSCEDLNMLIVYECILDEDVAEPFKEINKDISI